MPIELTNPDGLAEPQGFAHVGVARGSRIVFLAGQTAEDADGNIVGEGDLAKQAEQALVNVHTALAAAGASFADVAKVVIYVVDWDQSKLEQLLAGVGAAAARLGIDPTRPATLVGVTSLFRPEHLIEIDATAVLD